MMHTEFSMTRQESPAGYIALEDALQQCAVKWSCDRTSAWHRIRSAMSRGDLGSSWQKTEGTLCLIDAIKWGACENDEALLTGMFKEPGPLRAGGIRIARAFLHESDFKHFTKEPALTSGDDRLLHPVSGNNEPKSKGGRPEKYDWDALWIETCRIAVFDGLPERVSELRKKLQDWHLQKYGSEGPGETIFKAKLKALYAAMGRDGGTS